MASPIGFSAKTFVFVWFVFYPLVACQSVSRRPAFVPQAAPQSNYNAWLEIDGEAFERNVHTLQTALGSPGPRVCAVLKADAYGHGIRLLAPHIKRLGVPCVAVTANEEARAVRESGFDGELVRIRAASVEEIEAAVPLNLEETLGSLDLARSAAEVARRYGKTLKYHLSLNADGMSRDGLELESARGRKEALELLAVPGLEIVGIMTHFPVEERADALRVLKNFKRDSAWIIEHGKLDRSRLTLHCANSFATLEVPESRLDMVRPGGLLFGDTVPSHTEYLRVMRFVSRIASVYSYNAGRTVSYDRTFKLKRDSRLANVPVGYSNGYRRILSNQGQVLIRGRRYPVVGRVTMNTIMVDVTDGPADLGAGDEVVLFGRQGDAEITQAELEKSAGTIFADLYTIWGNSNPRVFKGSGY